MRFFIDIDTVKLCRWDTSGDNWIPGRLTTVEHHKKMAHVLSTLCVCLEELSLDLEDGNVGDGTQAALELGEAALHVENAQVHLTKMLAMLQPNEPPKAIYSNGTYRPSGPEYLAEMCVVEK
jgi:hypothetical protein